MVDNEHENLQWKISLNGISEPDHIYRCIEEGKECLVSSDQNLKSKLGLSHREENILDSRIHSQPEQSNSSLGIPKLPGQQRMETFPNRFQTNLQSVREKIIGPVCFQTLPSTVTIHSQASRSSKCSNRCISTGLKILISVCFFLFSMIGRILRKV